MAPRTGIGLVFMDVKEESAVMKIDLWSSAVRRPLLALGLLGAVAASASVGAQGPSFPSAVSVTSYYSDASHAYVVGVTFYGDCAEITSGALIGQWSPHSETTTVTCDNVGSVPMPF